MEDILDFYIVVGAAGFVFKRMILIIFCNNGQIYFVFKVKHIFDINIADIEKSSFF